MFAGHFVAFTFSGGKEAAVAGRIPNFPCHILLMGVQIHLFYKVKGTFDNSLSVLILSTSQLFCRVALIVYVQNIFLLY